MPVTNGNTAALPTGNDAAEGAVAPIGLVCNEIWGGNRVFHGPIELPGMHGALFSQPCGGPRGGDVHYLSVCGSGLLSRICLADVTGHGESVAAVSQVLHEMLHRSVNRIDERKVLRQLNLRLCLMGGDTYTTAAVLTYFPPTRRLSISYAGHEPAWYFATSKRRWSRLQTAYRDGLFDVPLAVEQKTRYTHTVQRVAAGDRLLLLTDGVLEAPDRNGELFHHKRLEGVLESSCGGSPSEQVSAILTALHEHMGGAGFHHDDVSILILEFVDNLESPAWWIALKNRLFRKRM